ncbi:E3 ubiquitin-protein ligase TRIM33-like [Mercenaria mercenaria]|uniref:E3 ubiquitin-protein ligase TRIM33-like n=1 Tax=Mercenaria mercenaria TaxID=6596 RepID=UPI00234E92C3|nr:E3 ubiquitin-protein ligase TRIM33-like [Mercenaria mercenaria]
MASSYQNDFTQDSDEVPEMHCEQCEYFGESVEAEGFCVNCLEYMCKSCLKYHARQNQHILQDRKTMPQDFCFEQCQVHKNRFIRFYCSVCEKCACIKCRTNDHKKCTGIGHVPTIAKGIENGKELKELLKDINLISTELDRTKRILNTCIQQTDLQQKHEKRAIEKKKEGRKIQLKQLQQMLTDKFDRFKTDMITVINKIQEENTACLTMELNMFDIEQTEKENNTLASLEKATTTGISNMRSLLATNVTLNSGVQTVLSDLNQKQNTAQRCKLFLALKTAMPYIKIQKQKMQELTTAVQLTSDLPKQTKENVRESDNEAPDTLTLNDLPESVDEERICDLFR